jgi:hypothetical protein
VGGGKHLVDELVFQHYRVPSRFDLLGGTSKETLVRDLETCVSSLGKKKGGLNLGNSGNEAGIPLGKVMVGLHHGWASVTGVVSLEKACLRWYFRALLSTTAVCRAERFCWLSLLSFLGYTLSAHWRRCNLLSSCSGACLDERCLLRGREEREKENLFFP